MRARALRRTASQGKSDGFGDSSRVGRRKDQLPQRGSARRTQGMAAEPISSNAAAKKVAIPLGLGFERGSYPGWLVPRDPYMLFSMTLKTDLILPKCRGISFASLPSSFTEVSVANRSEGGRQGSRADFAPRPPGSSVLLTYFLKHLAFYRFYAFLASAGKSSRCSLAKSSGRAGELVRPSDGLRPVRSPARAACADAPNSNCCLSGGLAVSSY